MLRDMNFNVEIHVANVVALGGQGQWDWRQNHAAGPYWRIYWNREPGAFVKTIDGEVQLLPDRVIMMAPGTQYATRTRRPVHHFYVHFSVAEPLSHVQPRLFQFRNRELTILASQLAQTIEIHSDSWDIPLKLHLYLVTSLLHLPEESIPPSIRQDPRITLALKLIAANPSLRNPELAASVNMSVNSFQELFRVEIGEPPQTYSRRKRLAEAAKLLHFGEASIDDIARNSGFYDRYHFSRAFKEEYGLPPATYRGQAQRTKSSS